MIVFATFSNNGGMKRVTETTLIHINHPQVISILFSSQKPELDKPHLHWIEWKNSRESYNKKGIKEIASKVAEVLSSYREITWVVGDNFTLPYFNLYGVKIVYDIHSLSLPLHHELEKNKKYLRLDELTKFPMSNVIRLDKAIYCRHEFSWLKKSSAYICNSSNTENYLLTYYAKACADKKKFIVPVTSEITKKKTKYLQKDYPFYIFSRWHPVKGYHLVLFDSWAPLSLTIRGCSKSAFLEESFGKLSKNNISFLKWSDDNSNLVKELQSSEVVIFPAIYEPYGLALQEAMSLGCLCVAHKNNSGHEEQLIDGENGFLIDMERPDYQKRLFEIYYLDEVEKNRIRNNAINTRKPTIKDRAVKLNKVFDWLNEN